MKRLEIAFKDEIELTISKDLFEYILSKCNPEGEFKIQLVEGTFSSKISDGVIELILET